VERGSKNQISGQSIQVASGNLILPVASQENQCSLYCSSDQANKRAEDLMLPWYKKVTLPTLLKGLHPGHTETAVPDCAVDSLEQTHNWV
jgi:hypothetical protein